MPAIDCKIDDAERALQRGQLVEKVGGDGLVFGAPLEFNNQPKSDALVGFVVHIGDRVDLAGLRDVCNPLKDGVQLDLEGHFGEDDLLATLHLLHVIPATHSDISAATGVRAANPGSAHDDSARGEVRTRQQLQ